MKSGDDRLQCAVLGHEPLFLFSSTPPRPYDPHQTTPRLFPPIAARAASSPAALGRLFSATIRTTANWCSTQAVIAHLIV